VPWQSSGWTGNRNVTQMLEFLSARGEVATAQRRGRQRLWDLAERVYPAGIEAVPLADARRAMSKRRIRALGVARPEVTGVLGERIHEEVGGEPAQIEGTAGGWRVDPEALGKPFEGRTALLSPFDRLVHDRERALDLFDFDYTLEMYKPAAQRRWGYFALPILHDDRLVELPDEPIVVEYRQREVAPPPLRRGLVHLERVVEVEEVERPLAIVHEPVERRQQSGSPLEGLPERLRVDPPLACRALDLRRLPADLLVDPFSEDAGDLRACHPEGANATLAHCPPGIRERHGFDARRVDTFREVPQPLATAALGRCDLAARGEELEHLRDVSVAGPARRLPRD